MLEWKQRRPIPFVATLLLALFTSRCEATSCTTDTECNDAGPRTAREVCHVGQCVCAPWRAERASG